MNSGDTSLATVVFALTIGVTFLLAWIGRRHSAELSEEGLSHHKLNRWLIALSAGATANSGFVVTGAVGLGYSFGLNWLLLPLGWLIGDLAFWSLFPHRINKLGAEARATTLTELISYGLPASRARPLAILSGVLVVACLGGYTMAQWVAGQKFLGGAFGVSSTTALVVFAALIITYTSIGGFRGSIYADSWQAILRLLGTVAAIAAVSWVALESQDDFLRELRTTDPGFLNPLGSGSPASAIGFTLGYAAASLGFGLGQPQVTSRYMAGRSPSETRAARWIYIFYVQFTWTTMTVFGVVLRGVMPEINDPEMGLSVFFGAYLHPVLVGLIVADMFGAMASTANSILVAMSQTVVHDLLGRYPSQRQYPRLWPISLALGAVTMALAALSSSTVFSLAITSVSLMGAGLAPAVLVKVLGWRHDSRSLLIGLLVGLGAAATWNALDLSNVVNEALVGIPAGLLANYLVAARATSPIMDAG